MLPALPPQLARLCSLRSPALVVAAYVASSAAATAYTSPDHSLLVTSVAWAILWAYASARVGIRGSGNNETKRRCSWTAGALLALAQVCDHAAHYPEGIWWLKSLLPATVFALRAADVLPGSQPFAALGELPAAGSSHARLPLALVTLSAALALGSPVLIPPVGALGLCSVVLTGFAFILLEQALASPSRDHRHGINGGSALGLSASGGHNGLRPRSSSLAYQSEAWLETLRDVASVVTVGCGVLALLFERSFRIDYMAYGRDTDMETGIWVHAGRLWVLQQGLRMAAVAAVQNVALFALIRQTGALPAGFFSLASVLGAALLAAPSLYASWLALIYSAAGALLFFDAPADGKMLSRSNTLLLLAIFLLITATIRSLRKSPTYYHYEAHGSPETPLLPEQPVGPLKPLSLPTDKYHPVDQLVRTAEDEFQTLLSRQSQTLDEAVAEYRRRYGIPPPPNFDRWFAFAKRNDVQLIDEYDSIYHSLLPFWALKPATIRARVKEALGYGDNALIGLLIRDGQAIHIEGGQEWQQEATMGMIKNFIGHLPDMDIAFNIHDEPRVVVPHDELSRLVKIARDEEMPAAFANKQPRNAFSGRPKDMNNGKRIEEVKFTRFNQFAHQATWTHSRLSCPPDSPARSLEEHPPDNLTAYAIGDLGFVYNQTAFSDICNSPSFGSSFGFFDRPNAFNLVQELFPIFSQSKISSYQDILYPSPWYWYGKVTYDDAVDPSWEEKQDSLYWRGSTTGGFSRNGGWRRQHRQHVVQRLNEPGKAQIMTQRDKTSEIPSTAWTKQDVPRRDYAELINVAFSHVGQCDPGDCDAQKEFFHLVTGEDQQAAWHYKHLLDMDGNAFSGRFYAFLQSKSAVYKMALFREWHAEWLKPWVHYVPMSLRGDEWLETVRYFSGEPRGKEQAVRLAGQGREWAGRVLRKVDFEAWFFRMLLEYGRLIDDDREVIGYPGP